MGRRRFTRAVAVAAAVTVAALVAPAGCGKGARDHGPPPERAFYYWRTTLGLTTVEQHALGELGVTRLYLRVFDVEWRADQDGPATMGPIHLGDVAPALGDLEVVPVVYLRSDVFTHLPAARTAELAAWTWREVGRRAAELGFTVRELQLDCDWTDSTRDRFFAFVRELDALVQPERVTLSATIRLHQIKYRERTGVPPVARGMLMFYNMGKFSPDPEARAIFDEDAARRYLARIDEYPLPLDAALPIWSWTIHLRDDVVEGLLQSTDPDELADLDFVRPAGAARYVVTRTAFLHGTLLREGDLLKVEVTGPRETQAAATMLATRLAPGRTPRTIALFDLSERNLHRHGLDDLDHVFRTFRH